MGYPVNLFVSAVDDNLLCSVCSGVLEQAVLTPCGHSFCSVCLHTWINRTALQETQSGGHNPGLSPSGSDSHDPRSQSQAPGYQSHDPGYQSHDPGSQSHAPGSQFHAPGSQPHAPGSQSYAPGSQSHDTGFQTPRLQAPGSHSRTSHTPGYQNPGSHTSPCPQNTRFQYPGSQTRRSRVSGQQQNARNSVSGPAAIFWESDDNELIQVSQNPGSTSQNPRSTSPDPGSEPQNAESTCPECRTRIIPSQIHPIRSLRSLILSMEVHCDYSTEGCPQVVPLENHLDHVDSCRFARIECAGCGVQIQRDELSQHQLSCEFISSLCSDTTLRSSKLDPAQRINDLSHQIRLLQSDLSETRLRNELLTTQLQQARNELEYKQRHLQQIQNIYFDPDYNYGFVKSSVGKLSSLVSRFLKERPMHIDSNRVFQCVKRCYDNFGRCGTAYEEDVWMLLATSAASNWFTQQQKQAIRVWQMSLARYKQCTQWTNTNKQK